MKCQQIIDCSFLKDWNLTKTKEEAPVPKKPAKTPILDLHGFKEDEVYDAVDRFLLKNEKAKTVHIMTGKGKGIVKKKVVQYLKQAGYPAKPLRMAGGKINEGVLVIYMN